MNDAVLTFVTAANAKLNGLASAGLDGESVVMRFPDGAEFRTSAKEIGLQTTQEQIEGLAGARVKNAIWSMRASGRAS